VTAVRSAAVGALVGAALVLAACGSASPGGRLVAPDAVPTELVPPTLEGNLTLGEYLPGRQAFAQAGPASLVSDGRLWAIRRGETLVGTLQISTVKGDVSVTRPRDHQAILEGVMRRLRVVENTLRDEILRSHASGLQMRCYVDTGPIVERVNAKYAGIGWIGKNTCIIHQKMGSWLFLGVILTSLELPPEQYATLAADRCGSCTRCIDACPTNALTGGRQMDASRCISYLTIEKRGEISEDLRAGIGRQVFGCDICQDVCPWNRKAPISRDAELAVREPLVNPALDWLSEMDEATFGRWFYGSPVKRAKFSGFRRNIAIAMGNSGSEKFLPTLRSWAARGDAIVAEAAQWAIGKIDPTL